MNWIVQLSDGQLLVLALVCLIGIILTAIALIDPDLGG